VGVNNNYPFRMKDKNICPSKQEDDLNEILVKMKDLVTVFYSFLVSLFLSICILLKKVQAVSLIKYYITRKTEWLIYYVKLRVI